VRLSGRAGRDSRCHVPTVCVLKDWGQSQPVAERWIHVALLWV
jgi:hypothetical protein